MVAARGGRRTAVGGEARGEDGLEGRGEKGEVVVLVVRVEAAARAEGDVALDLPLGPLHVLRRPGHFEARVPVSGRGDDVRVGDLLDALHRRAFGSHDEPHDSVRDSDEYRDLVLLGRGAEGAGRRRDGAAPARGADLRKVLGGRKDLPLRCGDVLRTAGDDEHRLLATYWGLDVRVRLCSQRLDFAPCKEEDAFINDMFRSKTNNTHTQQHTFGTEKI